MLSKGSFAYEFDTALMSTVQMFPKSVGKLFKGLPTWTEASIEYNNELYMFKEKL